MTTDTPTGNAELIKRLREAHVRWLRIMERHPAYLDRPLMITLTEAADALEAAERVMRDARKCADTAYSHALTITHLADRRIMATGFADITDKIDTYLARYTTTQRKGGDQ